MHSEEISENFFNVKKKKLYAHLAAYKQGNFLLHIGNQSKTSFKEMYSNYVTKRKNSTSAIFKFQLY